MNPYEAPLQTVEPEESITPFYARRLPQWFVLCFFGCLLLAALFVILQFYLDLHDYPPRSQREYYSEQHEPPEVGDVERDKLR